MHFLILTLLLLGIIFGPGIWVKRIMERYSRPEDRYPGTGGELARHLLDQEMHDARGHVGSPHIA